MAPAMHYGMAMAAPQGRTAPQPAVGTLQLHPLSAEHTHEVLWPAVVGGSWQVRARLGGGTFGNVYRASHVVLPEHEVALKLLEARCTTETSREKALHEVRLLASVSSPYVVQVKEWGWHEDRLYFTMPLYRGATLAQEALHGAKASASERRRGARRMFVQLAHGLAALHRAGLVHRDVKPENIYLAEVDGSAERFPILLDLGIARRDTTALPAGTPRYCAPEMARRFLGHDVPVGSAADVYGLALSLLEYLYPEAVPSSDGLSPNQVLLQRVGAPGVALQPAWVRNAVPKDLQPWFAGWLATNPADRPDATTFARELSALTRPEESRARARWAATRVGLPAALMVLALMAAVVNVDLHARAVSAEERIEHLTRVSEEQDHARDHEELSAVNGILHGRLTAAERSAGEVAAERDRFRAQRDRARTELAQLQSQRDALQLDRDNLANQRNALLTDRDRMTAERSALLADRDRMTAERNALQSQRDALQADRDRVSNERNAIQSQRDVLMAQRNAMMNERAELIAQRDQARAQRDEARTELARRMAVAAPQPVVPYPVVMQPAPQRW